MTEGRAAQTFGKRLPPKFVKPTTGKTDARKTKQQTLFRALDDPAVANAVGSVEKVFVVPERLQAEGPVQSVAVESSSVCQ